MCLKPLSVHFEILYNKFGRNGVNVFHAMLCQKQFYHLFGGGEKP